jgi:hypothetical protein
MKQDLSDYEVMEEFFETRHYDSPGKDWRKMPETVPGEKVYKHGSFSLILKSSRNEAEEQLAELKRLPSSFELRKLIKVLEEWLAQSKFKQRPGIAGFSLQKTKEMIDFNNWRTQTPDGIQWDTERRELIGYRHPGDPDNYWEQRYVYKQVLKFNRCHDPKTGKFCTGPGFGFVSPSVEENSITPSIASERTHSAAQERFLEVSRKIDSLVGLRSNIVSAVGAWADGAENTTMTTYEGTTFDQISVSAAMKGLIGNQKNVIAFQSSARGTSRMFSLSLSERDPAKLNEFLVRNGVEFHTLVPTENGTDVHIFTKDVNRTLSHSVSKLAKGQGVAVKKYKGKGDFLGDENWSSREDARKSYEKTIDAFLKTKPAKRAMWEKLKVDYGV